jgi:gliding motility-associated-like protein
MFAQVACDNWLSTPTNPTDITIGDLDITGNKVTLEAVFNRSTAFNPALQFGKLIYKGSGPADINYSLMPVTCEITTTNGYITTPVPCLPQFDKTYHVAMVYDGTTLKFYRNGFLMSSVSWSGNLITNNFSTYLGGSSQGPSFQHYGYLNEVRIWNTARTQSEIRTYMNSSLPFPSSQPGLQAYYSFDNLQNKQGNAAFNGTLNGTAAINQTNPNCNFVADSCEIPVTAGIGGIINEYTPILAFDPCKNQLTVENGTNYTVGDTVLMIQMKGAVIDSSNTAAFGTVTDYKSAGNYEFNYIAAKTGNVITLRNKLLHTYEIPNGKVQLIRVPYYNGNVTVATTLTCAPWDGSKGGVLAFNVKDTAILEANIDVTGKGFRGGIISNNPDGGCGSGSPDYFYPLTQPGGSWTSGGAEKGEGISTVTDAKRAGKGALANGGGGGNKHNAGGGGGSNYGSGGIGGNELQGCTPGNTGRGGIAAATAYTSQKIFMGGGGGRGDDNNGVGTVGANGGGIVLIKSDAVKSNNKTIFATGASQLINGTGIADGAGGGGGGGVILLSCTNITGNLLVDNKGGKGGSQNATFGCVGTGGGGGGGYTAFSLSAVPANVSTIITGGDAGIFLTPGFSCSGTTNGAVAGLTGSIAVNYSMPVTSILFKPNIDSVRIKDSATSCSSFDFKGLGYTNTSAIQSWQWFFGDGNSATTQNTSHTYIAAGTYTVKLVVTDINGCKDSITKPVNVALFTATASAPLTICRKDSAQLNVTAAGATGYSWTPALGLNNPNIANPKASPGVTTKYYVTATSPLGCIAKDSVTVNVRPAPQFNMTVSKPVICEDDTVQFIATGGDQFLWSPGDLLSDSTIGNPIGFPDGTTLFQVRIIESTCKDTAFFTRLVVVNPNPDIDVAKSNDINCTIRQAQLNASGASAYTWLPATGLSNNNISNPVCSIDSTITYVVRGNNSFGCSDTAVVTVAVTRDGKSFFDLPGAFTPNGDGVNDCFGIGNRGPVQLIDFAVYNRWGERVWSTKNPNECWNGVYKGQQQPNDAFVYYIKAKSFCGDIFRKGTVILIR